MTHIFKKNEAGNLLYCWFPAMHSRVDIVLVSSFDEKNLLEIVSEIERRIKEIEGIGNCFDPSSEVAKLNKSGSGTFVLSSELEKILAICEYWKKQTGGLFNISVEGRINLSGILKGYALDEIRPILERHGIDTALVNMGNSSVMALGCQPGNPDGWSVTNAAGETFTLKNRCLTTSGNDSESRKHIINPLTGLYIEGRRIVSVVTYSGTEGEVRSIEKFLKSTEVFQA